MVERADSILVDYSDPTAAVAAVAAEMMTSLVRRAKSTRETRREKRSPPMAFPEQLQRPKSLDLPSHPAVRPIPQRSATTKEGKNLSASGTTLKKRPSLLNRLRSIRGRPSPIMPSTTEEPAPKTPTDPHFVLRPKRGGRDLTPVAGTFHVPRDSQDIAGPRGSSTEKSPVTLEDKPREHRPVVLVDAPYPSPPLGSPRQKGECSRCHSKRIQREHSVRQLTGEVPPRVTISTSPASPSKRSQFTDDSPFPRSAASEKAAEAGYPNGSLLQPTSPTTNGFNKGHAKTPSWASYRDGDSDEEKVQAHRKSTLQPLMSEKMKQNSISSENGSGKSLLQTQVMVKRQKSVARRIVDKLMPARRASVKPQRVGAV